MYNNEESIFSCYPFEESPDYWKQRYYEMAAQRNKLQNEFNALSVENGKLTKLCYYYRHCLRSQKRLRRKMHIYKVEMERLRRKLTRIYKAVHKQVFQLVIDDNSFLPYTEAKLNDMADEYANKAVDYYKNV